MFDDYEDGIDTYMEAHDGKIFGETGFVIFPSRNRTLEIVNKDTVVSIFIEKRQAAAPFFVGGMMMNKITNFVFLYKFNGKNNSGTALVAQSFLDESKSKLLDDRNEANKAFSHFHHRLRKLANHKFIYHGARNEG